MSILLLLLDEDAMNSALVDSLRLRSVDVISVAEIGMLSRSDEGFCIGLMKIIE